MMFEGAGDSDFAQRRRDAPQLAPVRAEERERRACPEEDADVEPSRRVAQEVQQRRRVIRAQPEVRRDVPPRDPQRRLRALDRVGRCGQRGETVDQDLDGALAARRRIAGGPTIGGRVERVEPADASQPPPVVGDDESLQPLADDGVGVLDRSEPAHALSLTRLPPAHTPRPLLFRTRHLYLCLADNGEGRKQWGRSGE